MLSKVLEKVWEALVQSRVKVQQRSEGGSGEGLGVFGAEPGQVQLEKVPEKVWEGDLKNVWRRFRKALAQSQVRFNRVPEKVPELQQGPGSFGAKPSTGSGEGSGKGLEGCGAEPGQVFGEGSGEGLGGFLVPSQVKFNSVPVKVPEKVSEKVWEALVQSQARFNRVPEKVPEKFPGSLGAEPSQVQQVRQGFQRLALQHASERFFPNSRNVGVFSQSNKGFGADRSSSKTDSPKVPKVRKVPKVPKVTQSSQSSQGS